MCRPADGRQASGAGGCAFPPSPGRGSARRTARTAWLHPILRSWPRHQAPRTSGWGSKSGDTRAVVYAGRAPAMPSDDAHATSDLAALLAALDQADAAVRALYLRLAEDPDLAAEYEAGLRELHSTRAELARQVGLAALSDWRATRRE